MLPDIVQHLEKKLTAIRSEEFEGYCMQVFHYQYQNNSSYHNYCNHLNKTPAKVETVNDIPFLPIQQFKKEAIKTGDFEAEITFESSGTSQSHNSSQHLVKSCQLYEASFMSAFEYFYGKIEQYCILALLPSYLERSNSSLVYMTQKLIELSQHPQSGFYLYEHQQLYETLLDLRRNKQKTLLIGVSFALLDFSSRFNIPEFPELIVMETGGMKGRKEEIIRKDLHHLLSQGFNQKYIHSEYGMTELLSQAYSKGKGRFKCPPWMKVLIRETDDPFSFVINKTGGVNVIDLANIHSCSFIQTDDLGKVYDDESFEIIGRYDQSEIRGCNLMTL